MTALRTRPRVLTAVDSEALGQLVRRDRLVNCVLESRLLLVPDLEPRRFGGMTWGIESERGGPLRAAIFNGGNLMPVGEDLDALAVIAEQLSHSGRGCSSIVGTASAVSAVWPVLARRWPEPRAVRHRQPLLATSKVSPIEPDPAVRQVMPAELPRFLPAAVAMFTEELGVSPMARGTTHGYQTRIAEVVASGRAFARFDARGGIEFKAEIGAVAPGTAQVQGVWVRPDLRGRGIGTAAMASVIEAALRLAPTVSLYVNDFNLPARRMYQRLGMRQVNTLSTVLF